MKVFSRQRVGLRPATQAYTDTRPIRIASIHHGGPVGGPPMTFAKAAATWRSYQAYHQGNGWIDIGYNVGVDGLGRLYEGRPVGKLPAAVGGHNSHSIGIVFMQDGRSHKLNLLQRRTLRILFEKGEPVLNIPPLKRLTVKGHREFAGHSSNECPGGLIQSQLAWRRKRYQ